MLAARGRVNGRRRFSVPAHRRRRRRATIPLVPPLASDVSVDGEGTREICLFETDHGAWIADVRIQISDRECPPMQAVEHLDERTCQNSRESKLLQMPSKCGSIDDSRPFRKPRLSSCFCGASERKLYCYKSSRTRKIFEKYTGSAVQLVLGEHSKNISPAVRRRGTHGRNCSSAFRSAFFALLFLSPFPRAKTELNAICVRGESIADCARAARSSQRSGCRLKSIRLSILQILQSINRARLAASSKLQKIQNSNT